MRKLLLFLFIPGILFAQDTDKEDVWKPFRIFEGSWTGIETGAAGEGKGERTYQFIMNGAFLYGKNISRFEPQEKNPEGEVHEDWTFLSYDKINKTFVMRQFLSETYVSRYKLVSISDDGMKFVFISEDQENLPPGFRSRYTWTFDGKDSFIEEFELASPGKDFAPFIKNSWTRAK